MNTSSGILLCRTMDLKRDDKAHARRSGGHSASQTERACIEEYGLAPDCIIQPNELICQAGERNQWF